MPPSSELQRLLYVSQALIAADGDEPRRILDVARQRNAGIGVTGLLCYSGAHFAQILEGPAQALDQLMTAIRADPRHRMLREWERRTTGGARLFPDWAMGYTQEERLDEALGHLVDEPHDLPLDMLARVLFAGLQGYAPRP